MITSEVEYLLDEVNKLKNKVSELEGLLIKQGNYLNKIESEVDNSD